MAAMAALIGIALAIAAGAGLGAYRAAQSPAFYAAIVALLWDKLKPALVEAILKDYSPEAGQIVADAVRRPRTPSGAASTVRGRKPLNRDHRQ